MRPGGGNRRDGGIAGGQLIDHNGRSAPATDPFQLFGMPGRIIPSATPPTERRVGTPVLAGRVHFADFTTLMMVQLRNRTDSTDAISRNANMRLVATSHQPTVAFTADVAAQRPAVVGQKQIVLRLTRNGDEDQAEPERGDPLNGETHATSCESPAGCVSDGVTETTRTIHRTPKRSSGGSTSRRFSRHGAGVAVPCRRSQAFPAPVPDRDVSPIDCGPTLTGQQRQGGGGGE